MLYDRVRWLVMISTFFFYFLFFFFSSRRRHTRCYRDWSSDVCSSDLNAAPCGGNQRARPIFAADQPMARLDSGAALPSMEQEHPGVSAFDCRSRLQIGRASCRERV